MRVGIVQCWHPSAGTPIGETIDNGWDIVRDMCPIPLPDGRTLLATICGQQLNLWDPATGQRADPFYTDVAAPDGFAAVCAMTTPDGQVLIATGGEDGTIELWHPATRHRVNRIDHLEPLTALAALPDGQLAIAAGHTLNTMRSPQSSTTHR